MATITLTIPDAVVQRVLDAIAGRHGWDESLSISKQAFAKQFIINQLKDTVRAYEGQQAAVAAMAQATEDIDNDIVIT